MELGFWNPIIIRIPDPLSGFPDSKAQDLGFHKQKISRVPGSGLDSGFQLLVGFRIPKFQSPGFRIPQEKISRIPESRATTNEGKKRGKDLYLQMYLNSYQFFIYKLYCAIYLFLSAADHKSNMLPCFSSILSCYPRPWLHFDWFNLAAFLADYSSDQMLGNGDKLFANFFINAAFQVMVYSPAFVREFVERKKIQTILSVPKSSAKFRQRLFKVKNLFPDKNASYKHVTQITTQVTTL